MKWGALSNRAVDQIARSFVSGSEEVELLGDGDLAGSVGNCAENGLTANDHPFLMPRDGSGSAQDVFHLTPVHRSRASR